MPSGSGPTSPTPSSAGVVATTERKHDTNGGTNESILARQTSHDPTPYVQRTRVTRAAPPKPACNPLQFVQIKPCNLYQSAQEQLKRAEEVKKVKEIKKEEPEDWQSNLDNWKSSRRKRVEHIIDRVVEVKKLELEEHDKTRRKSKTFSEMLEERESKGRKASLAVYAIEDDTHDLSDLGIGTSSASGKSSLSEDFDNHSVISDNQDVEKANSDIDNHSNPENGHRDYVSSPGYDTSSSTAPASSPDPCEYTYEGAIQEYKTRVSRAHLSGFNGCYTNYAKDNNTPERSISVDMGKQPLFENNFHPKRLSVPKMIEDRLNTFEPRTMEENTLLETPPENGFNTNLTNVNVLKRRELFEKEKAALDDFNKVVSRVSEDLAASLSIKERLMNLEKRVDDGVVKEQHLKPLQLPDDFSSVKDILTNIENPPKITSDASSSIETPHNDVGTISLQDRINSITTSGNASPIEEQPPIKMTNCNIVNECDKNTIECSNSLTAIETADNLCDTDREDSGIHTADVSSFISQIDETNDLDVQPTADIKLLDESADNIPDVIPMEHRRLSSDPDPHDLVLTDLDESTSEQDSSVIEALEQAFKAIDTEPLVKITDSTKRSEPIYENVSEISELYEELEKDLSKKTQTITTAKETKIEEEPFYQVPKSMEPYYEVPKPKPVPLYENIEIFYPSNNLKYSNGSDVQLPIVGPGSIMAEPPKEKPPPPPVEDNSSDDETETGDYEMIEKQPEVDAFKRINSTRRIKKEIRSKRTSFLGIENDGDDEHFLEFSVAPPPDMVALIQEERRLEKQLYIKAGLYDSSDTAESRDSGVSENHSRQSSDPVSEEQDDFFVDNQTKDENKIPLNTEPTWDYSYRNENEQISNRLDEEARMRCLEDQIREQEEVLRVERELLQLEQEELKRQKENLLLRENLARKELDHGSKMLMSANRHSLQDINNASTSPYTNVCTYPSNVMCPDYRQSMPNLQDVMHQDISKPLPPIPPAKPQRTYITPVTPQADFWNSRDLTVRQSRLPSANENSDSRTNGMPTEELQHLRSSHQFGNMSRHTIHALSAAPKPKLQENWIQQNGKVFSNAANRRSSDYVNTDQFLRNSAGNNTERGNDAWLHQKRKSDPQGFNYNKHWLVQEAEQLRIDQQRGIRPATNGWNRNGIQRKCDDGNMNNNGKPLPDAIIQTLTQRVQNRGLGERKRSDILPKHSPDFVPPSIASNNNGMESHKEILSVSGKKKCSYCNEELGRGAAMIIESLQLFYHLDCFKCCVCRTQLGDGVTGADVRVRSQKLHCQNCFSSDDGIKFSCV